MNSRHIRVKGRVQGVGFRYALRDEAERAGVTGWVRNRADGSVEALLQGEPQAIAGVIAWAHRGPPGAHVSALEETTVASELQRAHERFHIRPSV
ncbi:MAG: acylphosphatase [Burkholderiales bacterium]